MECLEFQKYIISESSKKIDDPSLPDSTLIILGRGLGLLDIIYYFVEVCSDTRALVFVINATQSEEEHLYEVWKNRHSSPWEEKTRPKGDVPPANAFTIIRTETCVRDRIAYYKSGGIVSISSRMLISDMLLERIPHWMITGWIVLHAETVHETCTEAFILYLYRQHNQTGFIRAFSDVPEIFSFGISAPSKQMRSLQVSRVVCVPRFHPRVKASLDLTPASNSKINECRTVLTPFLKQIEECIISLMSDCWGELLFSCPELKRLISSGATGHDEDWSITDRYWLKSFDRLVHDRFGHTMGHRAFSILSEMKQLRELMDLMIDGDMVLCSRTLDCIITGSSDGDAQIDRPGWLSSPQASSLHRLLNSWLDNCRKVTKTKTKSGEYHQDREILDQHPKLKCLLNIINEINSQDGNTVLILVDTEHIVSLVTNILCSGPAEVFRQRIKRYDQSKTQEKQAPSSLDVYDTQDTKQDDDDSGPVLQDKRPDSLDIYDLALLENESFGILNSKILVMTVSSCNPSPMQVLMDHTPDHIILYDVSYCNSIIRTIDVYSARMQSIDRELHVHLIVCENSIEEARYIYQLKREKEAFERLISKESQIFVVHDNVEESRKILIDARELRGGLPFVLYKKGFTGMLPLVLQVGDFVLSPRICIERKTPEDLIGSFASGRLYDQVRSMIAYYERPFLLIEYDTQALPLTIGSAQNDHSQKKQKTPQNPWYRSRSLEHGRRSRVATAAVLTSQSADKISQRDISSKVVLLLLSFPKLGLLWSPSPWFTSQLFIDLQVGEQPPDPCQAMNKENEDNILAKKEYQEFDIVTEKMLTFIPGMKSIYQNIIMEKFSSVKHLISATQSELETSLGPTASEQIHTFFYKDIKAQIEDNDQHSV